MESPLNDNEQSEQETLDNYKTFMGGGPGPCAEAGQFIQCNCAGHPGPVGQPGISTCRASTLPDSAAERKTYPIASGVLDYFPDAIVAIAHVSQVGNDQHNPGQPLHWDRSKSTDEADTMQRHFLQRGTLDKDGLRHTAKMAWRALALLQKEIESERPLITEPTLAYPRYWKNTRSGTVYRALSSSCTGQFWSRTYCRWECCDKVDTMEQHVRDYSDVYIEVGSEHAKAATNGNL